jgi:aminopeptidase
VASNRAAAVATQAVPNVTGLDARAFAELLVGYCLDVQEREQVLVRSTTLAAPLLLEVQRSVLERGAWPLLRVELAGQTQAFYEHVRDWQLDDFAPLALAEARKAACTLGIQAPDDDAPLHAVDPERLRRATLARRPVRDAVMKSRWCTTLWPTPAAAARAGTGLDELTALVAGALFLDQPDPAAAWGGLHDFQARLIERLRGGRQLRIEAAGTDLVLDVGRRDWVNSDGRRNMPSGEVFTAPHEASANGRVRFTIPSSPPGLEIGRVELELRDGVVVAASADPGDDHLQRALATDDGARRVGEIGIGTNFGIVRPSGAILFDAKIGGTIHLTLGRAAPETGGRNRSALHWDLICDLRGGGRLTLDGDPIAVDGAFLGV